MLISPCKVLAATNPVPNGAISMVCHYGCPRVAHQRAVRYTRGLEMPLPTTTSMEI